MPSPYTKEYNASFDMIDMSSKVSVPAFINIAQDIATTHRESFGAGYWQLRERDACWVAVRAHFEFENTVEYGNRIIAYTWPEPNRHSFYPRMYHFTDSEGNTILKGCTYWSIYSFKEKKAMLPSELSFDFPVISRPEGFDISQPSRIKVKEEKNSAQRKVMFSDTDANGHLNNCKYISWIFDILPVKYILGCKVKTLDINYNSQIAVGAEMKLNFSLENDILSVNGENNGSSVFTRRIEFEKRYVV